jgi:hypothetical protein
MLHFHAQLVVGAITMLLRFPSLILTLAFDDEKCLVL